MLIKYVDQIAKEIEVSPPFIPHDVVQFVGNRGRIQLGIVTEVICHGEYTVAIGKKYIKWEIQGKDFGFTIYTKIDKFDLTDEQATFMLQNDARLNQYELKKFTQSTSNKSSNA
jgi:hypothetical protein